MTAIEAMLELAQEQLEPFHAVEADKFIRTYRRIQGWLPVGNHRLVWLADDGPPYVVGPAVLVPDRETAVHVAVILVCDIRHCVARRGFGTWCVTYLPLSEFKR